MDRMQVARIAISRAMQRSDEDDPLADVLLAVTSSTAAMLAVLDAAAGRPPLTLLPGLVVLLCHLLRLRRAALVAAFIVWLRVLGLADAGGTLAPLLMLLICIGVLIGPDRVIDWLEARWEASDERRWLERRARSAAPIVADGPTTAGWIEDLPDP
ncbi:MAG TPA: hypothetical protein VK838_04040 [Candidatus Limnocylindrales bacterium]|nr:hypothetical protein [Candidatus Limnocylindrales bacterium]